jgi:hypothetical protein
LYTSTWKFYIRYSEIKSLKDALHVEDSLKPIIGRPRRQSKQPHEIVKMIVKVDVTGTGQEEMVEKTIQQYAEGAIEKDSFGKSIREKIVDCFKRIAFVTISSYAAMVGSVVVYDPKIFENHFEAGIALLLVSIPIAIGIGAAKETKFSF